MSQIKILSPGFIMNLYIHRSELYEADNFNADSSRNYPRTRA